MSKFFSVCSEPLGRDGSRPLNLHPALRRGRACSRSKSLRSMSSPYRSCLLLDACLRGDALPTSIRIGIAINGLIPSATRTHLRLDRPYVVARDPQTLENSIHSGRTNDSTSKAIKKIMEVPLSQLNTGWTAIFRAPNQHEKSEEDILTLLSPGHFNGP